jgi:Ecdysteroid kinase-like family
MTKAALSDVADLTREWFTEVLRRDSSLSNISVRSIEIESSPEVLISSITKLRVVYEPNALQNVPERLFLKMSKKDAMTRPHAAKREVAFYKTVVTAMPGMPVPRCFDAHFDEARKHYYVLLEDLSETHRVLTKWPLPPAVDDCKCIVEAWAKFHAKWWKDPRLGKSIGEAFNAEASSAIYAASKLPQFLDILGDRLSPERRKLCERMAAAAPHFAQKQWDLRNITLTHGDAHFWNTLSPKVGASGVVKIVDWDNWRPAAASRDLAYMMAVHWYPERRKLYEQQLLSHYHSTLESCEIANYSLDDLLMDYRRSVIQSFITPLSQASMKLPPHIWWGHLERIMMAYKDLECEELMCEY